MGRPRAEVSERVVAGMASVGATNTEIAEFCGVSVDTITRRFADVLTKERAGMKVKLRRAQIKFALKGNATLLIWLGKNGLGQSDKSESDTGNAQDVAEGVRDALRSMRATHGVANVE